MFCIVFDTSDFYGSMWRIRSHTRGGKTPQFYKEMNKNMQCCNLYGQKVQ